MLNSYYIENLLGLKDIILKDVKNVYGEQHIYIKMEKRIHSCPRCKNLTSKVHDYREQLIKDIPSFGQNSYIHLKKRRHVCKDCGKKFFENVDFLPKYHRMTNRLFAYLIDQLRNVSSIKSASKHCNISQTTAARIFDKVSYPKTKLPEVLSIDEFKGNAGGEKFQCILTDPKHRKVLDILPRRRLDDLCQYFSQYNNRKDVKYVVMDMSSLFKSMAKACFPKARIVADRYHVVRQVTWAFEAVRKAEQKKFSKDRRLHFKRSRQILLKHSRKLADDEKDQISVMLTASERLRNAYLVKLQFEKVMECKDSATARKELSKWIVFTQSYQLPEFEACCTAFINWSKEILESFDCPYTNGYTEGCNNKIKVIKRNGYGIRNFDRFRNRILHIMAS